MCVRVGVCISVGLGGLGLGFYPGPQQGPTPSCIIAKLSPAWYISEKRWQGGPPLCPNPFFALKYYSQKYITVLYNCKNVEANTSDHWNKGAAFLWILLRMCIWLQREGDVWAVSSHGRSSFTNVMNSIFFIHHKRHTVLHRTLLRTSCFYELQVKI